MISPFDAPTPPPDFLKDTDGNKITDSNEIADNFNDFFTNICTKLADKITPPDSNYVSPLKSKNQQNRIFPNPTNPDEIIEITKNLKLVTVVESIILVLNYLNQ